MYKDKWNFGHLNAVEMGSRFTLRVTVRKGHDAPSLRNAQRHYGRVSLLSDTAQRKLRNQIANKHGFINPRYNTLRQSWCQTMTFAKKPAVTRLSQWGQLLGRNFVAMLSIRFHDVLTINHSRPLDPIHNAVKALKNASLKNRGPTMLPWT